MEWLRLYSEILNDSKIMLLPENYRWRYVALLCIASESKERGTIPSDEEVLFKLRITEDEWGRTKMLLSQSGLIHGSVNQTLVITHWLRHNNLRPSRPDWEKLRTIVFERDDYTCRYCGRRGVRLECDHVIPISRGGSNEISNLVTACFDCNRSKRDKILDEWRAE